MRLKRMFGQNGPHFIGAPIGCPFSVASSSVAKRICKDKRFRLPERLQRFCGRHMSTKKDDILNAAMTVFLEEGLKGARMERIADVASVSKRTLYKYFPDKPALFAAIRSAVLGGFSDISVPEFEPEGCFRSQLTEALRAFVTQASADEFVRNAQVLLGEFIRDQKAAQEFYTEFQAIDAPMASFLSAAMDAGHLERTDANEACDFLIAIPKSTLLSLRLYNMMPEHPTEAEIDRVVADSVAAFLLKYTPAPNDKAQSRATTPDF